MLSGLPKNCCSQSTCEKRPSRGDNTTSPTASNVKTGLRPVSAQQLYRKTNKELGVSCKHEQPLEQGVLVLTGPSKEGLSGAAHTRCKHYLIVSMGHDTAAAEQPNTTKLGRRKCNSHLCSANGKTKSEEVKSSQGQHRSQQAYPKSTPPHIWADPHHILLATSRSAPDGGIGEDPNQQD
ncbi:MAG: hypothetical protein FRX49_12175 [Trebouxia sp. A1-2]|nr:MAG: hypothetical protein FRX49_12175 [Trebouxia sp. A1-2]